MQLKTEDSAVRGVLWRSRGAWLTVRGASVLKPDGSAAPLDGEVVIHRSEVLFLQALPEAR